MRITPLATSNCRHEFHATSSREIEDRWMTTAQREAYFYQRAVTALWGLFEEQEKVENAARPAITITRDERLSVSAGAVAAKRKPRLSSSLGTLALILSGPDNWIMPFAWGGNVDSISIVFNWIIFFVRQVENMGFINRKGSNFDPAEWSLGGWVRVTLQKKVWLLSLGEIEQNPRDI